MRRRSPLPATSARVYPACEVRRSGEETRLLAEEEDEPEGLLGLPEEELELLLAAAGTSAVAADAMARNGSCD